MRISERVPHKEQGVSHLSFGTEVLRVFVLQLGSLRRNLVLFKIDCLFCTNVVRKKREFLQNVVLSRGRIY